MPQDETKNVVSNEMDQRLWRDLLDKRKINRSTFDYGVRA
jgi:hypothetical protein